MKTPTRFTPSLKSVAVAALLGVSALFSTGCEKTGLEYDFFAPPAYSSGENFNRQGRNAQYDWSQAIDDFDHDILMTRPPSGMTKWHVYSSD